MVVKNNNFPNFFQNNFNQNFNAQFQNGANQIKFGVNNNINNVNGNGQFFNQNFH